MGGKRQGGKRSRAAGFCVEVSSVSPGWHGLHGRLWTLELWLRSQITMGFWGAWPSSSSNPHPQRQTPGVPSVPACLLRLPMGLFPAMESGIRAAWLHSSCKSVIPTQKWLCKLQVSSPDSHQTPEMDTHQSTCLRTKVESTIDKNTAYTVRHHKPFTFSLCRLPMTSAANPANP